MSVHRAPLGVPEYRHPGYRHKDWLAGKVGRVALCEHLASGKEMVLKLGDSEAAWSREADLLKALAGSSASGYVVQLLDAYPAGSGNDPRWCIELEVGVKWAVIPADSCSKHPPFQYTLAPSALIPGTLK